jgi:hypothetical protein
MKNPVVITSLEEDFRKIGLIKESTEAPQAESDSLDEAGRVRVALRGGKKVRQQKTSTAERMMAKKYRRSAAGKKAAKKAKKRLMTAKGQRRAAKVAAKAIRLGTRQEAFDSTEALKAFANAAIIADKLAGIFTEWVKADIYESEDERMFAAVAGELGEIAESFADIATAMSEGKLEESSDEDIAAAFAEGLETVLDAVDLYEANADDEDDEDGEDEDESGND